MNCAFLFTQSILQYPDFGFVCLWHLTFFDTFVLKKLWQSRKIIYNAKKTGDAQIALGGLIKNATLALPKNKTLTPDANGLGANTSIKSNASNYTIKLTGDMSGKKFVGTSYSISGSKLKQKFVQKNFPRQATGIFFCNRP